MTKLSGARLLIRGKDRSFEPMHKVIVIADGIGIAIQIVKFGGIFNPKLSRATATCVQFPIVVEFPFLSPTVAMVRGAPTDEFKIEFLPKTTTPLNPNETQTVVRGYGRNVLEAITPVYVDFFEKHRRWLKAKFGGDANAWPPLFNFSRAIRNFISHRSGCVDFENMKAPPVTWHHLTYSPADMGKQVIGSDFDLADLIVLLFEVSDELDSLGCPLNS